jgi:hypothetical protein
MIKKFFFQKSSVAFFALFVAFLGAACSGQPVGQSNGAAENPANAGGAMRLQGSGASFPKPIYEKWVSEYGKINPNVRIDYQATGSGAGQKALLAKTADFGASDDPMSDEDLKGRGRRDSSHSDRFGRGRFDLQSTGSERTAQAFRRNNRRHLSRQHQKMERRAHQKRQSGR